MCAPDTVDAARIVGFPGSYVVQTAWGVIPDDSSGWDHVPCFVYLHKDGSESSSEEEVVDNYEPQESESEAETDWDATGGESSVVGPET